LLEIKKLEEIEKVKRFIGSGLLKTGQQKK
jgi:hypothetical protein